MGEPTDVKDSIQLGKAIQRARQDASLTQQELCNAAHLSYSTLAKIERGAIKTPSVFTVARVASVLNMSLDTLLSPVIDTKARPTSIKRTSKGGVTFVYVDINGCLVRFFDMAFTHIAREHDVASDVVETVFWRYNDAVCRGDMPLADFNVALAEHLGIASMDWNSYYLQAVEAIKPMHDTVHWLSKHYKIGLLSNIMPGQIDAMISRGLLPNVAYDVIVDSSTQGAIKPEERMYEIAEQHACINPAEILLVDDSRTNLMAAEHRGWKVLWFNDMHPEASADKIKNALEF